MSAGSGTSIFAKVDARADSLIATLIRGYFTKTSLLAHLVLYPVLMTIEGGDFHLFLDGISIEAVFIGLMVGISTKTVIKYNHHLREQLGHALKALGDLRTFRRRWTRVTRA